MRRLARQTTKNRIKHTSVLAAILQTNQQVKDRETITT